MELDVDNENPDEEKILTPNVRKGSGVSSTLSTGSGGPIQRWLSAHHDMLAGLYTFSSCICFSDLFSDGDMKLVIADLGNGMQNIRLNVYKGTGLLSQLTLVDIPSAICSFHMDVASGSTANSPALAVASGSFLYIYKNLKPFYKFQLPSIELNPAELDAWSQVKNSQSVDTCLNTLRDMLDSLRKQSGENTLSPRSQHFLLLNSEQDMKAFVDLHKNEPLKRQTVVTCLATLKKTVSEEDAISCLVIGTENCDVFVVEPDAFTVLATVSLPSVPVFIEVSGLFDVDYRLIISCRDAHIYTLKRGFKSARICVQLNSQAVGLVRVNTMILVGCMDNSLSTYTTKGICMWTLQLKDRITCMTPIDVDLLGLRLVAVALTSRQIIIYQDKHRVDCIETHDVVTSMKFGRYGREDGTLVMVSANGSLTINILKRTAKFYPKEIPSDLLSMSSSAHQSLNIPKKTKLFVDQTMRERDESVGIHRAFQHDLYKLKLMTARSYVRSLSSSLNPMTSGKQESLKLSAQVHGLGPSFRVILELQNTSSQHPSHNMFLTFQCDVNIYLIQKNYIPVPYLAPGFLYNFSTKVQCLSQLNVADSLKVFVVREGDAQPLITAVINMPSSEAPI